jgi:PAS domain S-box-containing protein
MDRRRLLDALDADRGAFRAAASSLVDGAVTPFAEFDGPPVCPRWPELVPRERRLVWRVWVLEDAPLGVTLTGAAYQDNPVLYANHRLREISGYDLADLAGENLRLLQGPDTEAGAVETLHDALRSWDRATVDLWNYRADGERFRNRVSVLPVFDDAGTVTHWFGVQDEVQTA